MAYPTTLPSYTVTAGSENANTAGGGTGLSPLLNAMEVDITALGTKMGTGSSTAASNTILYGTGAGTSAWQGLTSAQVASLVSDETGSGSLVFGNSPTIVTPTVASFTNAQHTHTNAAGGGVLTYAALAAGTVVQVVDSIVTAVATGTTVIPYDDTIPQSTEGDQYLSVAITPKSATNKLFIEALVHLSNSAVSQRLMAALFQDATASALAVGTTAEVTANVSDPVIVYHSMTSGTTSATTFKVRAGANGAGTTTLNGDSGARKFGGISQSWIKVTEINV